MRTDLVDKKSVHVRVKGGGEGGVVFDSAIALLQGLFPPTPQNKIVLANDTTIVAPLGGYQYVPGAFSTKAGGVADVESLFLPSSRDSRTRE